MEKIIDLHVHSNKSDGVLYPKEVIDECVKNDVSVISITDHDTIEAYDDELFEYSKKNNILLIPGVEISTKINKCGIHVLGYNIDINNLELKNKLSKLRNARHDYLYNVCKKLNGLGYKVNLEELDKIDSVTKAHISLDIISNECNKELLIENFGYIPNKGEFIETLMNEGCACYVEKESITPKEASRLIKNAGGKVVLAHPVSYSYEDNLEEEDIIEIINDMEISAIEGNYVYVDKNDIIHDDIIKWNKFALHNNLISTYGSDFHYEDGIRPNIGFGNINLKLENDKVNKIIDYLTK